MPINIEIEDEKVEIIEEESSTKDYFESFKAWHRYYLERFSLLDYRIYYFNDKIYPDNFATTNYCVEIKVAKVHLSLDWPKYRNIDEINIQESARHEALHLLFADLLTEAKNRFARLDELEKIEEGIVRVLEKFL
jgi:hypothetical protein